MGSEMCIRDRLKGDFEKQKAAREFLAKENVLVTELDERGQINA